MRKLTMCGGCRRHVFVDEAACPFCAASRASAARRAWQVGVAAAVVTASACGGEMASEPSNAGRQDGSVVTDAASADAASADADSGDLDAVTPSDGAAPEATADAYADGPAQDASSPEDSAADVQDEIDAEQFFDVRPHPPYLLIMR